VTPSSVCADLALGGATGSSYAMDIELSGRVQEGADHVSLTWLPSKVEARLTKAPGHAHAWAALEAPAAAVAGAGGAPAAAAAAVAPVIAPLPAAASAAGAAASAPLLRPPPAATTTQGAATAAGGGVKSAYASKKDWSKIEKDLAAEEAAEKPEGEEALQKLFRQIYAGADEDTRRAMNKSFQMSGGTVLSTNWQDVAKKNYETDAEAAPPAGQERRKWET